MANGPNLELPVLAVVVRKWHADARDAGTTRLRRRDQALLGVDDGVGTSLFVKSADSSRTTLATQTTLRLRNAIRSRS